MSSSDNGSDRLRTALPVLLGFCVLILNAEMIRRERGFFIGRNAGSAALGLLIVSVFIGLLLVVYPVLMRRMEGGEPDRRWFSRWVVVPLVLAILAPLLTVRAMETYWPVRTAELSTATPCLELYQQAASIRAENPRFRMPDNDRDERRCKINETVLR